ncbi:condensin complex subunit 3 [Bombina bombina]|uniref:condensin complex subunit 3 n=1 Tax=Bombina bombina TaxID=8345 RepID=UPI00235A5FAE|nr:condensin complex subunit 3 [Bombina bombina]
MTEKKAMQIKEAFDLAQKPHQSHAKLISRLKLTYNKMEDKTIFLEEFVHFLKYPMIVYRREPAVERVLDFVAKFVTSFHKPESEDDDEDEADEENSPVNYLFNFLLQSHTANSISVRFRVCQLINKLLVNLPENAQIDDDLFDKIHDAMLERLKDKVPNVRIQAVLALARLQDPSDENCPVSNAYMHLIENDSNAEVRRAVLSCIAPSAKSLPKIVGRTMDVKELVRKLAYQVLSEKVHLRALSIAQRVKLLQQGLNDRSDAVKEVMQKKLLQAWLRFTEGDVLELLHRLDVENSPEISVTALNAMFSLSPLNELVENCKNIDERKLIPLETLTPENVLYWRALCEYLKSKGEEGETALENILPEPAVYAEYLKRLKEYFGTSTNEEPAKVFRGKSTYDPNSNNSSIKTFSRLLWQTSEESCKKHTLHRYNLMFKERKALRDLQNDTNIVLREVDKGGAVVIQDYSDYKKELIRQLGDKDTYNTLRGDPTKKFKSFVDELIQQLYDQNLIDKAGTAMGSNMAPSYANLFMAEFENGGTELFHDSRIQLFKRFFKQISGMAVGATCALTYACLHLGLWELRDVFRSMSEWVDAHVLLWLRYVDDILILWNGTVEDLETFVAELNKNPHNIFLTHQVSKESITFLDLKIKKQNGAIHTEVFRKDTATNSLLHHHPNKLKDGIPVGQFLRLKRNCSTEASFERQAAELAGRFRVSGNQECFEEAFLPTLQTLFNAPASSPLADIDVANVAELLVDLTRPSGLNQKNKISQDNQGCTLHDSLATKICNEILKDPTAPDVRIYAKSLCSLELSKDNWKDLLPLLDVILEEVTDKICERAIEKLRMQLKSYSGVKEAPEINQENEIVTSNQGTIDEEKKDEVGEFEEPAIDTAKQKSVKGKSARRKGSTATRKKSSKNVDVESGSDQQDIPESVPVNTRPSRRAKIAAMEKTKMNLTNLINQEVN